MIRFDFDQYSPEWWKVRRGVPTASEFGNLITPKTRKPAAAAQTYIYRLIGDLFDPQYGEREEYVNAAMREGTIREAESRRWYSLEMDQDVQQVGFCLTDDGRFGCSPDALVGEDGALELKNPSATTHVAWLDEGVLPDEHRAQTHGHILVTGRSWCDWVSYCPPLPALRIRVTPDDFTEAMRKAMDQFWDRYQAVLTKIRSAA